MRDAGIRRYREGDNNDWGTWCPDPDCAGDLHTKHRRSLTGGGTSLFTSRDDALTWLTGHMDRHHPGWKYLRELTFITREEAHT